jgi:hypothetical protein
LLRSLPSSAPSDPLAVKLPVTHLLQHFSKPDFLASLVFLAQVKVDRVAIGRRD